MTATVGFVGLGLMGSAITANLLEAGFIVRGFDVEPQRRHEHRLRGGQVAESASEAIEGAEVAILSLPTSDIVRDVCLGPGGIHEAHAGLIVLDTTTSRPSDSVATAEALAKKGMFFLDTAVSGTAVMAVDKNLVALVGGDQAAYEQAGPVIDAFCRARYHMGASGFGVRAKLVVNQVMGINRLALAEGLLVGEQCGMDLELLLQVLSDSAASSRAMEIWGERMIAGRHYPPGGRIRSYAKDLDLILELGRDVNAPTWMATALQQVVQIARSTGLGEADPSAMIEVLRRIVGTGRIPFPPFTDEGLTGVQHGSSQGSEAV